MEKLTNELMNMREIGKCSWGGVKLHQELLKTCVDPIVLVDGRPKSNVSLLQLSKL